MITLKISAYIQVDEERLDEVLVELSKKISSIEDVVLEDDEVRWEQT